MTQRERADELLNQRLYYDARTIYIHLLEKNANDEELPLLIASAYAGESGLDVVTAFEFIKPLLSDKNSKIKQAIKTTDDVADEKKNNKLIISYLDLLSEFFRISGSYPYINEKKRPLLIEAILYVKSIEKGSKYYKRSKGLALLLNITQLLNYLKDVFPESTIENREDFSYLICNVDLRVLKEKLKYASKYAKDASSDYVELQNLNKKPVSKNIGALHERTIEIEELLSSDKVELSEFELMLQGVRSNFCV